MVVGSATVKPGENGKIKVSVIMHEGMGGPHLFHIFVKSSDPEKRVSLLKVKADIVSLETWRRSHPHAFYLPRDVANFKLRAEIEGIDAIAHANKAFGHPEQIEDAYLGIYEKDKKKQDFLGSEYSDTGGAQKTVVAMMARLEEDDGTSKKPRKIKVKGHPTYSFKNEAHEEFYLQSVNRVVWLFTDGSVARQSLEEVLKHIQIPGS